MMSAGPRLLVTLRASPEIDRGLTAALPDVPWSYYDTSSPEQRASAEAMLVGSLSSGLSEYRPGSTPRLRFVQRIYTGLDGFPFDWFPPEVKVAGNVGAFAPFVSEGAMALALAAARDLRRAQEMVVAGQLRPAPEQRSLFGGTVVVLGYGAIGRAIGERAGAFGARVVGVNRTGLTESGVQRMLPGERFRDALPDASVVFDARPLTRLTRGSIGGPELDAMREDAILVNVGRAATVDAAALYAHLTSHPRFRAGFDVWWEEDYRSGRLGGGFPFATLPNFFSTPHCAGSVPAAEGRALTLALENLARFFHDGAPRFVVERSEYAD